MEVIMEKWDRRDEKRKKRMPKHGKSLAKIYKNSVLRRLGWKEKTEKQSRY